jgi:hypothetical protein
MVWERVFSASKPTERETTHPSFCASGLQIGESGQQEFGQEPVQESLWADAYKLGVLDQNGGVSRGELHYIHGL